MEKIQTTQEESIFKTISTKGNVFNNSEKKNACIASIALSEDIRGLKRSLMINKNLSTKVRKAIRDRLIALKEISE